MTSRERLGNKAAVRRKRLGFGTVDGIVRVRWVSAGLCFDGIVQWAGIFGHVAPSQALELHILVP